MSLLTNPLQSGLLLQQAVLPYTFTTGELDSLKAKLQAAEGQLMQTPNKSTQVLPMSGSEIRTLLRMIDMTYLQGLSGSGHFDQLNGGMTPMLQQHQFQAAQQQQLQQQLFGTGAMSTVPQQLQQQLQAQQLNGALSANHSLHSSPNSNIKNPPPANYVCHKCNIMGHWIQECPLNTQQHQDYTKPPPANYTCHRCGIPGHWIKNCPTNGNPGFDNKPHLKGEDASKNANNSLLNNSLSCTVVNGQQTTDQQSTDNTTTENTAVQPPSKKRRLNQI